MLEAHMIFVNFGAPPHPLEKRTPPPVVTVVTNMSYGRVTPRRMY